MLVGSLASGAGVFRSSGCLRLDDLDVVVEVFEVVVEAEPDDEEKLDFVLVEDLRNQYHKTLNEKTAARLNRAICVDLRL